MAAGAIPDCTKRVDGEEIILDVAPFGRVMALGALAAIVFVRPVARVAAGAVVLAGVIEVGASPLVRAVAVGTLPAEVIVWSVVGVASLAVVADIVVVKGRIFPV